MGKALARRQAPKPVQSRGAPTVTDVVTRFLAKRNPNTRRAYESDLRDFASFIGVDSPQAAVATLVQGGHAAALGTVTDYADDLLRRGATPATVNRRLSAIRSALKVCRMMDLIAWTVEVEGPHHKPYRDTAGPGEATIRRMLAVAGPRDRAIVRLLYDLGLRRSEVVDLDLEHLDLQKRKLSIKGKGRAEREALTVPEPTCAALRAWLKVRRTEPGPLFTSGRPGYAGHRLTGNGIGEIVGRLGKMVEAGRVTPHGIRHTAVTEVLRLTGGNVAAAQAFARHKSVQTTMVYADHLNDLAGKTAAKLAASINGHSDKGTL